MKRGLNNSTKAFFLSITAAAFLAAPVQADCTYELFNIASVKGTTVGDFIDQLSEECSMSVIIADSEAEKVLNKSMNKTFLKNLTINEVLDLIVKENNLQYSLQNNVLKISYLQTKTYNIDYIISERKGIGSANITLSSNTSTSAMPTTGTTGAGTNSQSGATSGANSESGIKITSTDEVLFWDVLDKELEEILNRPEDGYQAKAPIINKNAGLVTVTATGPQIKRLDTYLDDLQKKMQTQVMIDVKMYSVVFSDSKTTGIDWSQIYALQNLDLGFNLYNTKNITSFSAENSTSNIIAPINEVSMGFTGRLPGSIFQIGAKGNLNEVIKFLRTQGDVYALSNPKIVTLNNQPALITAGTELFYKTTSTSTLAGGTTGEQATSEIVSSVFSGVLLDITPEISKDGSITLRINPSISETASEISLDNATRTMPPDLSRRQISSVVTVNDGARIILGGLINTRNINDDNKIPLLGDIPVLGYLFKKEGMTKRTEEIVIIIEPHIIKRDQKNLNLSDLGYSRLNDDSIKSFGKEEAK